MNHFRRGLCSVRTSLVWGEAGSIIAYIGSAEVELPVGTTDCHLAFGSGDTRIDIGPFKVVRED